jgi:signal peptide peptidase SppA
MSNTLSPRTYAHVLELVRERPWGILPSVLGTIREIVAMHVRGERLSEADIAERVGAAQAQAGDRAGQQQSAGVAILPLYGVIMPKANLYTEMSGATSVQGFMRMFRNALVDTEVKAIIIDVDSPGGLTDLVPEAAAEMRAARGQKPIVAVANTLMASCAYWLGSQADEVIASPSSVVGSIGVYTEHYDLSAAYEAEGINHTFVSAGKFKVEGNQFEALDDEAKRHVQELVNDAYGMFVNDVAKARGAKNEDVRNGYGQGRILTARMAVAEGLADRVDTLDATVKRMVWVAARQKPSQAFKALANASSDEARQFALDMAGIVALDEVDAEDSEQLSEQIDRRFEFEREKYARRIPA